jgi:hypothetical protein
MRRLSTGLLIVAIAAITTAALVDVFVGDSGEPGSASKPAAETSPTTTAPLPACDRDQLVLELEVLGGTNAVALRHVQGPPCQADLDLRVLVTSHGGRSETLLRDGAVLDGDYSQGVEQSVPFSICSAGSEFTTEAIAGPYRAIGDVQPGGENCEGAIREVAIDFGRRPGTLQFRITPLDPVTHNVSFLVDLPRRTHVRVTAQAGEAGPLLKVLDRGQRDSCRHIAGRDSCLTDYGPLGEGARDRWTVFVRKRSDGRAHISFAISFVPAED